MNYEINNKKFNIFHSTQKKGKEIKKKSGGIIRSRAK